jgi:beta-glucosidase-like glycosyl hydrolase/CubicO group peptidase (beta-lactamase class C family)
MLKKVFILIILITFSGLTLAQTHKKHPSQKWVDSVFQSLSSAQRLGQLFMVAAYSNRGPKHEASLERLITRHGIGGLIFFQGGPVRQVQMTNRLQGKSVVPLWLGMDLEWGLGMRLDSTISYPRQMVLGALENDTLIYHMGREIARQCRLLGVHINFAPVVDINSNPSNPVIGTRSFGERREQVVAKSLAYMKGLQDGGIIACAKHFPGHGDTNTDSHEVLPVVNRSREELNENELYPFKKLIDGGVESIMVAHLSVPALDPTPNRPTTLSPMVVNNLLRGEMEYEGLVFTDALNMGGITGYSKPGQMDLQALLAGNDVLLFPGNVPAAIKLIQKEMDRNENFRMEVERKVKRILKKKYLLGLNKYRPLPTNRLIQQLNGPEAQMVNHQLNRAALTVASNKDNLLPVSVLDTASFCSLTLGTEENLVFQSTLDFYAPFNHYNYSTTDESRLKELLPRYDYTVVAIRGMNNSRSKQYGLKSKDLEFLRSISNQTNLVLVVYGNPYSLKYFEDFETVIVTHHDAPPLHIYAPGLIFGAYSTNGKLPVTASSRFLAGSGKNIESLDRLGFGLAEEVQMSSTKLEEIDKIIRDAISEKATPGCQVLVARKGKIVFEKSYGFHTYDSLVEVNNKTVYDLASITKVASTMQATMLLSGTGNLNIDLRPSDYLPELRGSNKEDLTFKSILAHQSGLVPFINHWEYTVNTGGFDTTFYDFVPLSGSTEISPGLFGKPVLSDSIWQRTVDSELRDLPEDTCCYDYKYSDVGYYLVYRVLRQLINQPVEDFVDQNFYSPLGRSTLTYRPLCHYPIDGITPSEIDMNYRMSKIQGYVHDPGAAMSGGAAGHAGLFSNARDLAVLMQMNLQDGHYGGHQFLPSGIVKKFATAPFENNRRAIGWDKPKPDGNGPSSDFASFESYGHSGFTGTLAWVDPNFDLVYIFLSNRTFPDSENAKLITDNVRTRVQDVIYKSIFEYEASH